MLLIFLSPHSKCPPNYYYSLISLYNQHIFSNITFHKILNIRTNKLNEVLTLAELPSWRGRVLPQGKVCDLRIPHGEIKRKKRAVRERDEVRDEIGKENVSGRTRTTNQSFLWNERRRKMGKSGEGGREGRGKTKVIADNRMARDSD